MTLQWAQVTFITIDICSGMKYSCVLHECMSNLINSSTTLTAARPFGFLVGQGLFLSNR